MALKNAEDFLPECMLPQSKDAVFVNCKKKYYPNGDYKMTVFRQAVYKLPDYEEVDYSPVDTEDRSSGTAAVTSSGSDTRDFTNSRVDHSREAKMRIFDIALMNYERLRYMITLTVADSDDLRRSDSVTIYKKVKTILNNWVKRNDVIYLLVPELHKDGCVHFHGLIGGDLDYVPSGTFLVPQVKKPVKEENLYRFGLTADQCRPVYNIGNYKLGFSTAVETDGKMYSVAAYITKYITKDLNKIFGNYYLAGGRGLVRKCPTEVSNMDFDDVPATAFDVPNCNNHVKYIDFKLNALKEGCTIYDDDFYSPELS